MRIPTASALLALALGVSRGASAQIVNIESARMQSDTKAWMGNINAGVTVIQNVDHVLQVGAGAHLQYKKGKDLWLVLGSYDYGKVAARTYADNSLLHLRYNRKLNDWLRWEVFAQAQNNIVSQVTSRTLLGTGPRFKLVSGKILRVYAASLVMLEKETENTDPRIRHQDARSSSYLSFTLTPSPTVELIATTYYQPRLSQFSDYRVTNQSILKVRADKHFSLSVRWNYLHDPFPAGTAPRTSYTFGSGIDVEF